MRARSIFNTLKNPSGFSLTEALVGVGMITAMAFLVAKFSSESPTTSNSPVQARTCEAIAQGVIDRVKGLGAYKEIYDFTPYGGNRSAMNRFAPPPAPAIITNGDLWGGGAALYNVTTQTSAYGTPGDDEKEVSTAGYSLVEGYMRVLMALYNSNPGPAGYCQTWVANPDFSAANLQLQTALTQGNNPPLVEIQIRPFNSDTGAEPACPAAVRAYPPGDPYINAFSPNPTGIPDVIETAATDGQNNVYTGPDITGVHNFTAANRGTGFSVAQRTPRQQLQSFAPAAFTGSNVGFKFNVRVTYTQEGADTSCEASQNFQYYADTEAPSIPTVSITGNDSTDINHVAPHSNRRIEVTFEHTAAGERGIQLYCRDRSEYLTYDTADRARTCMFGGSVNPSYTVGVPSDASRTPVGATVTRDWVPCDQVRACGRAPVAGGLLSGPNNPPRIRNLYDIPSNEACDVIIDVVAIDPAGNRSDTTGNQVRTRFDFASAGTSSVIRRPRCIHITRVGAGNTPPYGQETRFGWWCAPSNTAPGIWSAHGTHPDYSAMYPNGYYTNRAGGCCHNPLPSPTPPGPAVFGTCTPG